MTKRFYIPLAIAVLSVLLVQCSDDPAGTMNDSVVRFSAVNHETKAITQNALQYSGSAFSVIGAHADDAASFPASSLETFRNETVSWNGSNWAYSPTRYWVANSHYRFRAVHPASCATESLYTDDLHSSARLRFSVAADPASQTDLLMTDLVSVDYVPSSSNRVDLVFKHLLCNVNVEVKTVENADDRFTIDQISLIGPGSEWTLNLGSTDNGASWTPVWSRVAGSASRQFNSGVTGVVTSTTGTSCFGAGGLLIVPEDNANVKLKVVYKVEHKIDESNYGSPKSNTVEYAFPVSPAWQAGKSYTYTLTMAEQYNIKFGSPTVRDWGEIRNTGTIVIK